MAAWTASLVMDSVLSKVNSTMDTSTVGTRAKTVYGRGYMGPVNPYALRALCALLPFVVACSDVATSPSEAGPVDDAADDGGPDVAESPGDASPADATAEGGPRADASHGDSGPEASLSSDAEASPADSGPEASPADAHADASPHDSDPEASLESAPDAATLDAATLDAAADASESSVAASSADAAPDAPGLPADLVDGGPPPPDPTSATSFLINPAHTNAVAGSTLQPPLTRIWTANLPGIASYPLIVEGRVYVVSAAGSVTSTTATVFAFDAQTGATLWSTPLPVAPSAGLAYDDGRLFTADSSGFVSAFDAATGALAWTYSMVGPYTWVFSSVPTAYRGVLYTSAAGDGGTLFAFDEATGALLFQNYDPSGGYDSPPALEDDGLIVAYACQQTYKRDRFTGALLWHYATACGGGGADIPVIEGGRVYITDPMGNIAIDVSNGTSAATFTSTVSPSFDGTFDFFVSGTQLTAVDALSGLTAWTFAQNNGVSFLLPPLLAAGHAYTIDSSSHLTAFDENSGKPVWSDSVTTTVNGGSYPIPPMAASGGILVVPGASQLVAYASAGSADAGGGGTVGGSGCAFNMADVQEPVVGADPSYVAIGDLNGDGTPDLAVADDNLYGSGTVSVLLGVGNGTFFPAVAYATGEESDAVTIADLNGDGKPDLAVLNAGGVADAAASSLSVLLGNGDGTFQPQVVYATYMGSASLVVADLNGDGKPDVAVGNDSLGYLSVLLGNGDGTFQPAVTTFDPDRRIAVSLVAGDLNGDGKPDLVFADENYDIDVLVNNGDGTFQPAVPYATFALPCCVTEPGSVAMADVNGDGKLDIAVANYGASSASIFLGNGDGTMQAQVPYTTNNLPQAVRFGDINGDGVLDLVVSDGVSPDLSVLLGNGDGTFQPQIFFAVKGNARYSMAVGDVNGDQQGRHRGDVVADQRRCVAEYLRPLRRSDASLVAVAFAGQVSRARAYLAILMTTSKSVK